MQSVCSLARLGDFGELRAFSLKPEFVLTPKDAEDHPMYYLLYYNLDYI